MTEDSHKDTLYSRAQAPRPFAFDGSVVDVFPDMIRRSVPGYEQVIAGIGLFTRRYYQSGTTAFDLGCSLGAAALSMRHNMGAEGSIVAIDSSEAMVERCRKTLRRDRGAATVDVREGDIRNATLSETSLVAMNYTLQFVPPEDREDVIRRIANVTVPGGVLILSEKIRFEDEGLDKRMAELHHDFKRANGYSDMEIAGKRAALENVLIRDTLAQHHRRLAEAGFTQVIEWHRMYNFVSLLAIR